MRLAKNLERIILPHYFSDVVSQKSFLRIHLCLQQSIYIAVSLFLKLMLS